MKRIILVSLLIAAPAYSQTEVLTFGQAGTAPVVTGTESGGVTTMMAVDAPVTVTSCIACPVALDVFNMNAMSVGPAITFRGFVVQNFSGTFSITQNGVNVLSGTFSDATFGAGTSLVLSATNAASGETLSLNSAVIPQADLAGMLAMSLSLAVAPIVTTRDSSLAPFNGSIAGTFASTVAAVPEPGALPLMLVGLGALGVVAWRRRK